MYLIQFPQISNRASWPFLGLLTDLDDVPIDLTGMTMVFGVYDNRGCARLVASTDNGKLTILGADSPGQFSWFFSDIEMRSLCRGTYETGLTLKLPDDSQTVQVSVGPLPVIDGNVP